MFKNLSTNLRVFGLFNLASHILNNCKKWAPPRKTKSHAGVGMIFIGAAGNLKSQFEAKGS